MIEKVGDGQCYMNGIERDVLKRSKNQLTVKLSDVIWEVLRQFLIRMFSANLLPCSISYPINAGSIVIYTN